MDLFDSFLLGLLQGLTEFLPISSSGHLVLARTFLGQDLAQGITFEVVVHFGTLCSIAVYYWNEIKDLLSATGRVVKAPGNLEQHKKDPQVLLVGYILISMIPAMVIGLLFEDWLEEHLLNPFSVSIMLIVTGTILFGTKYASDGQKSVNGKRGFLMGLAQAFAILPGVSRSGSTISMGLYLGMKRDDVANFSFLMVIPVIGGAMLLKVIELIEMGIDADGLMILIVGFATAFVSGYLALKYLIIILRSRGIDPFAWYCWLVGLAGLYYFSAV
jgi:undecaprenyl-diphosphatase